MDKELDDILQKALASYSAAEPLSGLEERILARVRGTRVRRQVGVWAWAAVALSLACFCWLAWQHKPVVVAPVRVQTARNVRSETPGVALLRPVRMVRRRARKNRLTREEAALLRYVSADPEGAAKEFAALNDFVNRDLAVKPLVFEPIKIESLQ